MVLVDVVTVVGFVVVVTGLDVVDEDWEVAVDVGFAVVVGVLPPLLFRELENLRQEV